MENRFVTPGGVDIFSYCNNSLHSFYIALFVKAGVLYEPEGKAGITHVLEHCVFRNIKSLKQGRLYKILDTYGLSMNAATCKEFVQFTISGSCENFNVAAELISLVFEPVNISLADFKTELGRIRSEIREEGEKTSVCGLSNKKVWQETPLENSISGNGKSISNISRKALLAWQKQIFSPENMFFYLTGNATEENIKFLSNTIDKYSFCKSDKKLNIAPMNKYFFNRQACCVFKNSDYCKVMLNFDLDCKNISFEARHLLYSMLFDGESCLVFSGLSEDSGIIYSYDSCIEEYNNIGCLKLSYDVKQSNLYKSLEILINIFNSLKYGNNDALSLAKVPYTKGYHLAFDSPYDLCWDSGFENHILGLGYQSRKSRAKCFSAVTNKDIQYAAQKIFRSANLVSVIKADLKNLDAKKVNEFFSLLDN